MTHKTPPPDMPEDLRAIDAALHARARQAALSPEMALSAGFTEKVLARTRALSAPAASTRGARASVVALWMSAAAAVLVMAAGLWQHQRAPIGTLMLGAREGEARELRRGAKLGGEEPVTATLDGSRIHMILAAGSQAELASAEEVRLSAGQSWFHVEPRSGPFAVETPQGTVRVVGTIFGVSCKDGSLTVAVQRGAVRVETGEGTWLLNPGETWSSVSGVQKSDATAGQAPEWVRDLLLEESRQRMKLYFPSVSGAAGAKESGGPEKD
jgi:ferric-dicitrate binding protein FerR (iron transport regulator)